MIVQPAPMKTHTNTTTFTTVPTPRIVQPSWGKVARSASLKPITYIATEIACARKKTIPIVPPNSTPRLRLIR